MRKQELTWYTLDEKKPLEGKFIICTLKSCLNAFIAGIVDDGELWEGYLGESEPSELELCQYVDRVEMIKEWAYLED